MFSWGQERRLAPSEVPETLWHFRQDPSRTPWLLQKPHTETAWKPCSCSEPIVPFPWKYLQIFCSPGSRIPMTYSACFCHPEAAYRKSVLGLSWRKAASHTSGCLWVLDSSHREWEESAASTTLWCFSSWMPYLNLVSVSGALSLLRGPCSSLNTCLKIFCFLPASETLTIVSFILEELWISIKNLLKSIMAYFFHLFHFIMSTWNTGRVLLT